MFAKAFLNTITYAKFGGTKTITFINIQSFRHAILGKSSSFDYNLELSNPLELVQFSFSR